MMATIDGSGSPQYFVYRPLPDSLSRRQHDDYLQDIFVADLRSAFALITNLQSKGNAVEDRARPFPGQARSDSGKGIDFLNLIMAYFSISHCKERG